MSKREKITESSGNVFEDLGFPKPEAAALLMRSELMVDLVNELRNQNKTQKVLGEILGIGQSRVSDLMKGKAKLFSLDMLVTLAQRIGMAVKVQRAEASAFHARTPRASYSAGATEQRSAAHINILEASATSLPGHVVLHRDVAGSASAHVRRLMVVDSTPRHGFYVDHDLRGGAA